MECDIKKIRIMLGYSQQDFANLLGIDNAHLCRLEKGKVNLSKRLKELLVLKFNVNKDYLDGKNRKIFQNDQGSNIREERLLNKEAEERLNSEDYVFYNSFSQELNSILNSPRSEDEEDLYTILKQLDNKNFNLVKNVIIKLYLKQKKNENK